MRRRDFSEKPRPNSAANFCDSEATIWLPYSARFRLRISRRMRLPTCQWVIVRAASTACAVCRRASRMIRRTSANNATELVGKLFGILAMFRLLDIIHGPGQNFEHSQSERMPRRLHAFSTIKARPQAKSRILEKRKEMIEKSWWPFASPCATMPSIRLGVHQLFFTGIVPCVASR